MKDIFVMFIFVMIIVACHDNSKLSEEILSFQKKTIRLVMQNELVINEANETLNKIHANYDLNNINLEEAIKTAKLTEEELV